MKVATVLATALTAVSVNADTVSYEQYHTDIAAFISKQANSTFKPFILGGTEVPVGTSQYVAGMRESAAGSSFCGGSLIHPKWVLTAAHCEDGIVWVKVGTHYAQGNTDGKAVKVLRRIKHPKYDPANKNFDFLLLELESEVSYPPVQLALASGLDEPVGATATVLGWGDTREAGSASNVLLKVDVGVLSNTDCAKSLSITNNMICAGGKLNKDSCQGDSGGPLVTNLNGKDTLIGVVSWGNGCGRLGYPGVYARVSTGRQFIDQYVPKYVPPVTPVPPATPVPPTVTPAPPVPCGNDQVGPCPNGEYCQPWNPNFYQCRTLPATCGLQEVGVDYYGDDLATVQLLLPEECCEKCASTAGCKAYTFVNYNADGKAYCYLKTGTGQKVKTAGAVSATIVPPGPSCATPAWGSCGNAAAGFSCCPSGNYCQPWDSNYYQCRASPAKCSQQFPNTDFYGDDLATVFGIGPDDCCEKCAATAGCKAYTFVNDNISDNVATPACYLKTGTGVQQVNPHAVSGIVN